LISSRRWDRKRDMCFQKKKFYITTSIAYTNAPPHLGYALEVVQADVLARYHRLVGEDVFFLTGTDEHGQKVVKAASEAGKSPQEFCDEISGLFRKLKDVLNLSNDDFIRTSDKKRHWPVAEKVWLKLQQNKDIYKKKYKGLYCVGCEAFVKEKDLVDNKCSLHGKEPELIEEENWFFRLSKYASRIEKAISKDEIRIYPQVRKNEILSFIRQGVEDTSCSRPSQTLKWGIPVPGDESQTIYIWLEALLNYISALDYDRGRNFKKFWPADVHFVGKDIFRFHALLWPGILFSLKLPLPRNIFVHGFINVDGQKMSKSLGNVIDPFELVRRYGTDPVRYFLLREITPNEDGDFTYSKFEQRYNSDLAKGLGNFAARVVKLKEIYQIKNSQPRKFFNSEFDKVLKKTKKEYDLSFKSFKFNESLMLVWDFISFCDRYIEREKPWEGKKEKIVSDLISALFEISYLVSPFLPATSESILKQLRGQESRLLFPRI
jgi:methionyl-tRNA synthetase